MTTPYAWPSVSAWVLQSARLTAAPAASWWILLASMRCCPARNSRAEFRAMLGAKTWFTAPWSWQIHQQSRSSRVSAEMTERDRMAWHLYHGSWGAVPRGMWRLLTHWQHPTYRKMRYRQEVLQRPRRRERRPSTVLSPPLTCFFSGGGRDSWSLVRRGSQPHCRNRQKSHALHSRSAGNYVPCLLYTSDAADE